MQNNVFKTFLAFIIAYLMVGGVWATTLEEQFEGLLHCDQSGKLKGIYFDEYLQQPNALKTPYIIERNLVPCEPLESLAIYCVNDHYYGVEVEKIAIPYRIGTYAIYFKEDIAKVRESLSKSIKIINYNPNNKSLDFPSLIVDPDNEEKTILFCDFSSDI